MQGRGRERHDGGGGENTYMQGETERCTKKEEAKKEKHPKFERLEANAE